MEATCEENINSLKLVLSNVEKPDALPFEIDVKNIKGETDQETTGLTFQHVLSGSLMICLFCHLEI
jgi:hypothetical protein